MKIEMRRCAECNQLERMVAYDPRQPPLELGKCLCVECSLWLYEDAAEYHEQQSKKFRNMIEKLHNEN